jgi:phosphatidylglycerol lysyltransferase
MRRANVQVPAGCEHFHSQAELSPHLVERLRKFAFDFGETYSAYLVTEPDREYLWGSGRQGVVGFGRRGRFVTVADGLLSAVEHREALLGEFLAFVELNCWHVSFLNVPRNEINLFRRNGCEVTKFGEEPMVRLQGVQWRGKDWEWVRRQESYCRRQGAAIREVNPTECDDDDYQRRIAPQIEGISRDHIAQTLHRREMRIFVSHFSPHDLRERRLFVAEQEGSVIAFIVCNPGLHGKFWAVEVYRRRRDAVRGVIPAMIMFAMRQMQSEGVEYVSLSLAPFVRCTPVAGDNAMFRTVVNFWWRRLNRIFDVQGLFHFKSRFRPHYREMYVAACPPMTIRSLIALVKTWQLFHFNPWRLLMQSLRRSASGDLRTLATPDRTTDRRIRKLRVTPPCHADARLADAPHALSGAQACAVRQAHEEVPV